MLRFLIILLPLSLAQSLLAQESDTILSSHQKLYYDIEMGQYYSKNEEPLNDKYEVPLGVLEPIYPDYKNDEIVITADIKVIMHSNSCETIKRVKHPSYSVQSHRRFKITAVEIKECSTVLHFKVRAGKNRKFSVPRGSCICVRGSFPKFIEAVEGDANMGKWISKNTSYKAIFPSIPEDTKTIDFKELNKGGNWYIFGLELK